jgi:hypothetical protein
VPRKVSAIWDEADSAKGEQAKGACVT